MRVLSVAAARPNFVKVAPIISALDRAGIESLLVHTGQHYDRAMSAVFFEDLGMRPPDFHLNVGSGTHAVQTGAVMAGLEPLLDEHRPDVVLAVGDVNSTLACCLVAAKSGALVGHVEAGLRSRDWGMPEEVNRLVADRVSDLLFAPSPDAASNLRAEGYHEDQIHTVGNVMVDSLLANLPRAVDRPILERLGLTGQRYALSTIHRPSNVDDESLLRGLIGALEQVNEQLPVILPAHPRTRLRLNEFEIETSVKLISPVGYLDSLCLQSNAALVLTDSGGMQEETTALGVPCLTLRENTERPITVSEGTNQVVGTDRAAIVAAATRLLENPPEPRRPPLWDGNASTRIVSAVQEAFKRGQLRPTEERSKPTAVVSTALTGGHVG